MAEHISCTAWWRMLKIQVDRNHSLSQPHMSYIQRIICSQAHYGLSTINSSNQTYVYFKSSLNSFSRYTQWAIKHLYLLSHLKTLSFLHLNSYNVLIVSNIVQMQYMSVPYWCLNIANAQPSKPILDWYRLLFIPFGIYNVDSHFFDTSRVWIFDNSFVLDTLQVYIPCKIFQT